MATDGLLGRANRFIGGDWLLLMRTVVLSAVFGLASVSEASAKPTEYPDKPIRLIVPYATGGATDVTARVLASEMSGKLGQQVVVENKPGVAGAIGAAYVASQPADGYTLLFGGAGNVTLRPLMDPNLSYKPERDLATVNHVVTYDHLLVVRADLGVNSVAELVQMAKSNPGKMTFGSSGSGGSQHLAMELFKQMAGVDIMHVPYKGEAPAATDLAGGRIDMSISSATAVASYITAGRIKALATTNRYRSPAFPDLPTVSEAGVKGYEVDIYGGVMAPAGTPPAIIDKLNTVIVEIVTSPAIQKRFHDARLIPVGRGPAEFADFLSKEREKWGPVIKSSGAQL